MVRKVFDFTKSLFRGSRCLAGEVYVLIVELLMVDVKLSVFVTSWSLAVRCSLKLPDQPPFAVTSQYQLQIVHSNSLQQQI